MSGQQNRTGCDCNICRPSRKPEFALSVVVLVLVLLWIVQVAR